MKEIRKSRPNLIVRDNKSCEFVDQSIPSEIEGKEHAAPRLVTADSLCEKLVEKITNMPPELRDQFEYSIASQGLGLKMSQLSDGEIEVTPPKTLLVIRPVKKKDK